MWSSTRFFFVYISIKKREKNKGRLQKWNTFSTMKNIHMWSQTMLAWGSPSDSFSHWQKFWQNETLQLLRFTSIVRPNPLNKLKPNLTFPFQYKNQRTQLSDQLTTSIVRPNPLNKLLFDYHFVFYFQFINFTFV